MLERKTTFWNFGHHNWYFLLYFCHASRFQQLVSRSWCISPALWTAASRSSSTPVTPSPGITASIVVSGWRRPSATHRMRRLAHGGWWWRQPVGIEAPRDFNVLLFATQACSAQSSSETTGQPRIQTGVSTLDVHNNLTALDFHPIGSSKGSLHVFLVFVLHKSDAPRFSLLVGNEFNVFDGAICLHFSEQFSLGNLVRQASNEKCIITVHSLVLATTVPLELAILVYHRFSLIGEVFGPDLGLFLLYGFWCGLDDSCWRRRFLKFIKKLEDAL